MSTADVYYFVIREHAPFRLELEYVLGGITSTALSVNLEHPAWQGPDAENYRTAIGYLCDFAEGIAGHDVMWTEPLFGESILRVSETYEMEEV